jgi:DNA helicase-2/ATP-dependent DNA helicase PcrA
MEKGKPLQRAVFVDEIADKGGVAQLEKIVPEAQLVEATLLQLQEVAQPKLEILEKAVIDALLKDFSLSVSAMNRFLKCPLSFYYERILRVPTLMSEAAAYGTAMHNALQRFFDKMLLSKTRTFPDIPHFLRFFENEMSRQKVHFSSKEYERRLETGRRNLEAMYRQLVADWHKNVKVEFVIKNVEIEGVPVNGTIDKLELHDGMNARIVDYKTGSQDKSKLSKMTEKNPLGGIYRRQLIFYKLLYEYASGPGNTVSHVFIQYLEPDEKGFFIAKEMPILREEVAAVKNMITETYQNIIGHRFYEGCGKPDCSWCSFVKDNVYPASFSDPEIESLDD